MSTTISNTVEIRVTPWCVVTGRPGWEREKTYEAWRIWQRLSQWGWEQRHEWRRLDGGTRMESWIRGSPGWAIGAEPWKGKVR